MRKFTLFIASLFLAVGAMAQTFVEPEVGKYYKIKGDHSSLCWLTSEIDQSSKAIKVSSNENDAAVFERTSNGFRVVSTGEYLGMNGSVISYVGAEAAVTVHNTGQQSNTNGKYAIKVVNNWLYNNSTEANPVTHESADWISNIERFWGFIEVNQGGGSDDDGKIVADGVYTIDNEYNGRGSMAYGEWSPNWYTPGKEYLGLTGITLNGYAKNSVDVDPVSNKYWYVKTTDKGVYIYNIGKGFFLQNYAAQKVTCSTEIANGFVLVERTANNTKYVSVKSGDYYLSYSCGWEPNSADGSVRWLTSDEAAATLMTFTPVENATTNYASQIQNVNEKIAEYEIGNAAAKEALRSRIEWVTAFDQQLHMIGDAVGQYSSSNDDFAYDFIEIQEFCDAITDNTPIADINDKLAELEALIATFSPNMPVNGKAYTFKNVQKDGTTVCWFTYNNGCIELTTNKDEATAFICRSLGNDKYAFTMNAGKYMIWRGSNAGYYGNKGVSEFFDAYADFIINKMTTHTNFAGDLSTTRYMTIQGHRNNKNVDEYNNYVIAKNNGDPIFDQAVAPFYNDNFSSAFIMDEVEYANKPKLNAVGTSELLTSDLHNKVMATFSAPFPTVVPAGVTAYCATDGDGYVSLKAIEGAVPANTGVILVGNYEEAVTVAMAPAAGEKVATVEGNVLAHSAGAAVEISGGYILGAKNGVAGFYKANSGTLAMNKAYIAVDSNQESVEIRLPGTTAISEVKGENENVKAIYDLTGRRVEAVTAPGIYIVNGKKVLVK